MITLRDVHKSFGRQALFEGADLQINQGDRYALVGPNGSGKSTLFKMLLGEVEPDDGEFAIKRGAVVGYLPQENAPLSEGTVLKEAVAWLDFPDGRDEARAKELLMGLGFEIKDFERPVRELSGGWAMRVAMVRLLLKEPDLLLLDEPTNHLDLDSLLWLQQYLDSYPGAIFVISHDRAFINHVCSAIVSVQEHRLKVYRGDYEKFVDERRAEKERLKSAYNQQQVDIGKMVEFIRRNRARLSTAGRAQNMQKRLDRLERIELPDETKTVKIRFPQPTRTGQSVLRLIDLHKSYGSNRVYEGLDFELERGQRMAFVGHNGAGKSTLIKVLAGAIPFDSGERKLGLNVKAGYFSQHRAGQLDTDKTVLQEAMANDRMLKEVDVRTVLGTFLFPGDAVYKKTHVLSGGEKSRLALVKLLLDPPNVLLLDEPTTHLDMDSVEALIAALDEFEGTICFISHDLYFVDRLANHIVHVDKGRITMYPGNYEYFQRRRKQMAGEAVGAEGAPPANGRSRKSGKERRKERAAGRFEARETARLERELEKAGERLEELAHQMADPKIYGDFKKVQDIGEEMHRLQDEMIRKEEALKRRAGV